MEYRSLDLTIISATDLRDVSLTSRMKPYVVVSLSDNPEESRSPVDVNGGTNPTWSYNVRLAVNELSAQHDRLDIHFKLRCYHRTRCDEDIGEATFPVRRLLDGEASPVTCPVIRPSGRREGELKFSYRFIDDLT